ncbi:transglycosylase domain-containing protein [Microbacterium kribbense]|uniref:Transglycosylase domain-containing protein n=1 Tax=Microbacterium kribbense TaxID=433645 RepID=A0ABP7GAI9_9MICO
MPHSKRTAAGVAGGLLGLVGLSAVAGVLITATVTPAVAVTGAAATSAIDMFNNLPSVLKIDKLSLPTTLVYKDKGKEVTLATYYDQNRDPVTFKQIAPVMRDAILSSEDPRFYQHGGIDITGTTRAILSNLKPGSATQGGSSISQQYVKNVLVQNCYWTAKTDADVQKCYQEATDSSGVNGYQRKLQEMRYAIALEQKYSKNDILLGYLNIANFGGVTYGIEAAAWHYFGVHASKLTLEQASTLAGMVQNPNVYRIDMPKGTTTDQQGQAVNTAKDGYVLTKGRQKYVLDAMLRDGKITQKQHDEATKAPIVPKLKSVKTGCAANDLAPYFCQYVTSVILNDPAFGTADQRKQLLQKGGLKVYTTLDPRVQKAAQNAQNKYVPKSESGKDERGVSIKFGSTSVSIEASTGRVLAIAQNTDYVASGPETPGKTSLVYAGGPIGGSTGFEAGSTFKLFTLLDWLEQGRSLNEVIDGTRKARTNWTDSCVPSGSLGVPYDVKNFDKGRGAFSTPKYFTKVSLNSGFAGMAHALDLCDIGKVADRLGVTLGNGKPIPLATDKPEGPAEIIGGDAVSPMAMAGAYAAVANKGVFCQPRVIDKIIDADGNEMTLPDRTCTPVLDPKVAATAAYALKGPLESGGSGVGGNPWDGTQLIGKTGTNETWQTWLITSNTQVTTANWVGSVNGHVPMFDRWYKGTQLSNIRFVLGRTIQGAIDGIYPGGQFPEPDSNLTRRVLVNLPSVVGMSQDDATRTLRGAGFQVTVGAPVDSDLAEGLIAAQSPGAGKTAGGTTVTISPSNGKGIPVPDVSGQQPQPAVSALRAAGFSNVNAVCKQNDGGDGTVSGTDPSAGTVAGPSTAITVTYQSPDCGGGQDKPGKPGKSNGGG